MIEQAIVPVAGLGTRLLPISRAVPKELLPIGPKPALQWIAEELVAAGIRRIILVASPAKRNIDQLFRRDEELETRLKEQGKLDLLGTLWSQGPYRDTEIMVAMQDEQLGLGHAILCGAPMLKPEPFLVALGDCLMAPVGNSSITRRLIETSNKRAEIAGAIAFEAVPEHAVSRYGIASPADSEDVFRLNDVVEKPSIENAPSNLAIAARYVLSHEIVSTLQNIPNGHGGEIQLTDAIRKEIASGRHYVGIRFQGAEHRIDVGNYDSFAKAFIEQALTMDPALKQTIESFLKVQG
ncbi:MAG: sugar phosphate nucleotidyltransferase [Pirellulaceae bacterium]